jgi:hypothetical protein
MLFNCLAFLLIRVVGTAGPARDGATHALSLWCKELVT